MQFGVELAPKQQSHREGDEPFGWIDHGETRGINERSHGEKWMGKKDKKIPLISASLLSLFDARMKN